MLRYGTEIRIYFIFLHFIQNLTLRKITIVNYAYDTFIKYELLTHCWKPNAL